MSRDIRGRKPLYTKFTVHGGSRNVLEYDIQTTTCTSYDGSPRRVIDLRDYLDMVRATKEAMARGVAVAPEGYDLSGVDIRLARCNLRNKGTREMPLLVECPGGDLEANLVFDKSTCANEVTVEIQGVSGNVTVEWPSLFGNTRMDMSRSFTDLVGRSVYHWYVPRTFRRTDVQSTTTLIAGSVSCHVKYDEPVVIAKGITMNCGRAEPCFHTREGDMVLTNTVSPDTHYDIGHLLISSGATAHTSIAILMAYLSLVTGSPISAVVSLDAGGQIISVWNTPRHHRERFATTQLLATKSDMEATWVQFHGRFNPLIDALISLWTTFPDDGHAYGRVLHAHVIVEMLGGLLGVPHDTGPEDFCREVLSKLGIASDFPQVPPEASEVLRRGDKHTNHDDIAHYWRLCRNFILHRAKTAGTNDLRLANRVINVLADNSRAMLGTCLRNWIKDAQ